MKLRKTYLILRAISVVLFALMSGACGGPGTTEKSAGPTKPWRSFVSDLTNTARIARMDVGGTRILTTYDRSGGNDDFNYFPAKASESSWVVLADLKGPGVVRRLWTTGVDFGHQVRFFFDGEKSPRFSGAIENVFGRLHPFEPPLAQYLNQCWWSYIPLTYAKSLRIEFAAPPVHPFWGPRRLFYQINVEDLPAGTGIETTPAKLSSEDETQLSAVTRAWREAVEPAATELVGTRTQVVARGSSTRIFEAQGPGVLPFFFLAATPVGSDATNAIRRNELLGDLLLRVTYDDQTQPSIETPLGDFFGQIGHVRSYGSVVFSGGPQGFRCHLPMPIHKSVRVDIVNRGQSDASIRWQGESVAGDVAGLGYLHAFWSQTGPAPGTPHLFADIRGQGHLAGLNLQVTGLENSWWILEGDESFFVDGEQAPSWHGTGLEDYFNGGWYYRGAAFAGLHGIFDRAPFQVTQYRSQLVDPLKFKSSLRMTIERGDQNVSKGFFRSTVYAYLSAPSAAPPCPVETPATRAPENPYYRQTFMLQLTELERMNDFRGAMDAIDEYLQRFRDAPENGIYRLRRLEYEHVLGRTVDAANFRPFIDGQYGADAAEQAKLLAWFYEQPNRALVGLNANGKTRLFLDGKPLLEGDHPYHLFTAGVELTEGTHTLGAESTMVRGEPWVLASVRTKQGVVGTGPGTRFSRTPGPSWNEPAGDNTTWGSTLPPDTLRGTPDAPMIGGVPNAFVLLPSKAFAIRAQDWGYHQGKAFFRIDFQTPLKTVPEYIPVLTGLTH